jgi:hypothetical protein
VFVEETEKDLALREMLFRYAMRGPKGEQVWFIDYGKGEDPPPNFLRRFTDLPDPVRNVSEAEKGSLGVRDPETGKIGYIVHARIIRWIDENTAEVECSAWHNGLAAHCLKGIARFKDGKWTLQIKGGWVA